MKIIKQVPVWALFCLTVLSSTNEAIYSAALPGIAAGFKVSTGAIQATSGVYFAGFALGILTLGRLSDFWGRRSVVLLGITLYVLTVLISVFINDIDTLIAIRFCQGFGASVGSVVAQAMARDSYKGNQLAYIYTSIAIATTSVPPLGSTISGYVVEYYSWRHMFGALSIVAAVFLTLYFYYLPETNPYIGKVRNNRFTAVFKVVITDKVLLLYGFMIGVFNGMAFGFAIEAPFIIKKYGLPPSLYGKLAFLLAFAGLSGSMTSRYLLGKFVNPKKIMISGLALSLASAILLMLAGYYIDPVGKNVITVSPYLIMLIIYFIFMLHVVGFAFLMPLVLRYALEDYAKVNGTSGSIFGFLYYVVIALIMFIIAEIKHIKDIADYSLSFYAILFFILSSSCSISFYLIQKWQPLKKRYEFE